MKLPNRSAATVTISKQLRPLAKRARRAGWTIEQRNGGHLTWTPPDGGPYIVSSFTPSDPRAVKNLRADLRRAGLAA